MSHRITLLLLSFVLSIFLVYFVLQRTLFPSGEPIADLFDGIIQDTKDERWTLAIEKVDRLKRAWERRKSLVALNYSEADYQVFEDTLYELDAAIETKERFEAVSRAKKGRILWNNFLKLIPEP